MRDVQEVQSHKTQLVVLSAERAELSDGENRDRTRQLFKSLEHAGAAFMPVEGRYEGMHESGFVVILNAAFSLSHAIELAERYNQDSVRHLRAADHAGRRDATLIRLEGGGAALTNIGKWRAVPESEALRHDAYTKDLRGYYYVVK